MASSVFDINHPWPSSPALVEEAGIDVQAFRDMDEAMMWLQEPAQGYLVPDVSGVPQTL